MTCVSGGGAFVALDLERQVLARGQFVGSVSIDQHGLFVDDAGALALLHCGSTVSLWFALPKLRDVRHRAVVLIAGRVRVDVGELAVDARASR